MPWNEPGQNGKQKDPWDNKNRTPSDLDKIVAELIKKVRAFLAKKNLSIQSNGQPSHSKEIGLSAGLLAGILLILWVISGFFIVNPAEEAVILRLGQYSETLQPGLHWIARFIETKTLVDAQKIYSFALEGNFLTKSAEQGDLPNPLQGVAEVKPATTNTLDQSKNLVNVELNVQYRISDPRAYLFNVVNPDDTIQQVASGALSDVIGKMKLDDVLTTGRESLSAGVLERVKQILTSYQAGLEVVTVTLRKVQAPDQVRAAFNDVNRADQDKATTIQQAEAYASKVVPIAQGVAARTLADAKGYQQQVVLRAEAAVSRYQAILKAYQGAPDVTRQRIYLETIQTVFENTSKVLVDTNGNNNLIYLPLDKLIKQEKKIIPIDETDSETVFSSGLQNNTTETPAPLASNTTNTVGSEK